ncbi:hypothetical protein XENOCAPTIV_000046 [Xenoophorus captivus]|uniref:Uncharacterized protein n=1 Tax=Xenoophorus captivus TaxID=1517983 RepID=A0ABV0QFI6_9TELE
MPLFFFPGSSTLPCLHSFFLSVSLCHLYLFCQDSSFSPTCLLLSIERKFLFTTGNSVPALLTNQQEGISTRDEPRMLAFFFTASHVSLSYLCVFLCVLCVSHTWVVVIIDRGLL